MFYTYPAEMGWDDLNLVVTGGGLMFAASFLVVAWNIARGLRRGAPAGDNPWDAGTLEWATSSPPPPYNFARIPLVTNREPLWAERDSLPVIAGLRVLDRELVAFMALEGMGFALAIGTWLYLAWLNQTWPIDAPPDPAPVYGGQDGGPAWGLTPLEDQQIGGLIMWVPARLVYAGAALALMAIWIRRSAAEAGGPGHSLMRAP